MEVDINPDGDGIGSACALLELLLEVGKKVCFVSPDPIPPRFFFLDKHNLFEEYSGFHFWVIFFN